MRIFRKWLSRFRRASPPADTTVASRDFDLHEVKSLWWDAETSNILFGLGGDKDQYKEWVYPEGSPEKSFVFFDPGFNLGKLRMDLPQLFSPQLWYLPEQFFAEESKPGYKWLPLQDDCYSEIDCTMREFIIGSVLYFLETRRWLYGSSYIECTKSRCSHGQVYVSRQSNLLHFTTNVRAIRYKPNSCIPKW